MLERQILLYKLRNHEPMTGRDELALVAMLSVPSMMAQLSTIIMQYIDAGMVGSLGAEASASIGLVSTTIWLFGGLITACSTGFYVQVAHRIGANDFEGARNVLRQSFVASLLFSTLLAIVGVSISPFVPQWLGGTPAIQHDATLYFLVFSLYLPVAQLNSLCGGMLRCSGNVHVPSLLNVLMCFLDVVFNALLIFPTRTVSCLGYSVTLPGADMGVLGAVCGTGLSFLVCASLMVWFAAVRSPELSLKHEVGRFIPTVETLRQCLHIATPIGLEHSVKCCAQIVCTIIIAPLGTVAIAANSFGIIVESLCYMPGYGIADAATTLVGQSLGAGRKRLARSFSWFTISLGIGVMTLLAIVMYIFSPELMSIMTPDESVRTLTVEVLRIEAFAEPMFAASIVAYGVFVGLGSTRIPCYINLCSMWLVRIPLSYFMVGTYGLHGVWIAMAIELCFRGVVFLWHTWRTRL